MSADSIKLHVDALFESCKRLAGATEHEAVDAAIVDIRTAGSQVLATAMQLEMQLAASKELVRDLEGQVALLAVRADWMPQFDALTGEQESLAFQAAVELCQGKAMTSVDVLELAERLYLAERKAAMPNQDASHG